MTTTHMNYMMNPLAMLLNKIIDKVLPSSISTTSMLPSSTT